MTFLSGAGTAGLTWIEHYGLTVPGGSTSQDPIEGLVAEGFAANGLNSLGISMPFSKKLLKGTLAFRRLDTEQWWRGKLTKEFGERAKLQNLSLTARMGSIPLNTLMKETPDNKKADLIALCTPGTNSTTSIPTEVVVVRIQIKMGKDLVKAKSAATKLVGSWTKVLEKLQNDSKLTKVQHWKHVPIWMSAHPPSDKNSVNKNVRLICGADFWKMAIPSLKLVARAYYGGDAPHYD